MSDLASLLAGAAIGYVWRDQLMAAGERIGWAIGRTIVLVLTGIDVGRRPDG